MACGVVVLSGIFVILTRPGTARYGLGAGMWFQCFTRFRLATGAGGLSKSPNGPKMD